MNEEPDSKERKEAFNLAVSSGDYYCKKGTDEHYPTAEKFYKLAFKWDAENNGGSSEETYIKLYEVLGKQGKCIEGIRATLKRILETNLMVGDNKLIKDGERFAERLELMVGLLDTKFKLIEKQLEEEKKLRLEQKSDFETRIQYLEGREKVRVDAEIAQALKEEEEAKERERQRLEQERLDAERREREAAEEARRVAEAKAAEARRKAEAEAARKAEEARAKAEAEEKKKALEEAKKCQFINEAKA